MPLELGLRANIRQFLLLVLINALVGSMIGLERSILPELAQQEFGLSGNAAILSFIAVFGVAKAVANYFAGRLSDVRGRKTVLVWGWLMALPVPVLLMTAGSWSGILWANALLGLSQGFTWSTTVIMKIDLVGPKRRGLAMGLNEFAGYLAVALSAWITGIIAERHGLRPAPFTLGLVYAAIGTFLSAAFVRETRGHAAIERQQHHAESPSLSARHVFLKTTFQDRNLSAVTQAGLVNNLNDGMAWGLFPILYSSLGLSLGQIGLLAGIYPAVWGVLQLWTGYLSDRIGRKPLIAGGMLIQALGILFFVVASDFTTFVLGSTLLGLGTAMVYPTLMAAIGDVASPEWRASAVGVYRLWRDLGYAAGAVVAGVVADRLGIRVAIGVVSGMTAASGVVVLMRMRETLRP